MTETLTAAQRKLLVALLELSGRNRWVPWERLADHLGHESRGRAAVSASLNRLSSHTPPLVCTAYDAGVPVVTLTAPGREAAANLHIPVLPAVEVRTNHLGSVDEVVTRVGSVHIEMLNDWEAVLIGPGGMRLALVADRHLLFFPRLRIEVLELGDVAEEKAAPPSLALSRHLAEAAGGDAWP